MTKCALVTGVTSGIGKVIVSHLLRDGWEVYGIGRDFSKCEIEHSLFHPLVCDLCVDAEVRRVLDEISCCDVSLLINNAGSAYYGMHEEICAASREEPSILAEMRSSNTSAVRSMKSFVRSLNLFSNSYRPCLNACLSYTFITFKYEST